jgi:hypothetical protein
MSDRRIVISAIVGILILGLTIPVAMGHGFVDQSCDCATNYSNGLSEFTISGQQFTPTVNNLVGVDILLYGFYDDQTQDIRVLIWEESIGTKLLGEATQTVSGGRESITVHYDFDKPIPLTPGIIHVIQVEGTSFWWQGDFGNNLYPDGAAYYFGVPNPEYDLMFRTYFESPTIDRLSINPEFEEAGYFYGHQIVEVRVSNPDISKTNEAKGEPEVNVNGETLRMVQTINGDWYGYFADNEMAQIVDYNTSISGSGPDFGTFCGPESSILDGQDEVYVWDTIGIAVNSNDGIQGTDPATTEIPDCDGPINSDNSMNVLNDVKKINSKPSHTKYGQIGMDKSAWPFIQLFPISDNTQIVIEYAVGGGVETSSLTYVKQIPSSEDLLDNLTLIIEEKNLPSKMESRLIQQIEKISNNLEDENLKNDHNACQSLDVFINKVKSQAGKEIDFDDAQDLIDAAKLAKAVICN